MNRAAFLVQLRHMVSLPQGPERERALHKLAQTPGLAEFLAHLKAIVIHGASMEDAEPLLAQVVKEFRDQKTV